jgi:hypothetical protein
MFCGYCGKDNAKEYIFCTGCGKPLEKETTDQHNQQEYETEKCKDLPQENKDVKNHLEKPTQTKYIFEIPKTSPEKNQDITILKKEVPQSNYISVNFWKHCEWPWQAWTLDEGNLLGAYGTELEAAISVANFHGINVADLWEGSQLTEDEVVEKKRLLIVKALEKSKSRPSPVSSDDIWNAPTKQSPSTEDFLSFDTPWPESLPTELTSTPMPILGKEKLPPDKSLSTEDFLSFDSPWPENFHSGHANKHIPVLQKKDASPKKSPPTQPNISEKIKEAVEEKKYYVDQFIPFYETGKGIKPWNWAALLIGPFWCLYRKVYSLFFVYTISYTVSSWVEKVNMSDLTQLFIIVLSLIAWIQVAIEANRTYYKKLLKKIKQN